MVHFFYSDLPYSFHDMNFLITEPEVGGWIIILKSLCRIFRGRWG